MESPKCILFKRGKKKNSFPISGPNWLLSKMLAICICVLVSSSSHWSTSAIWWLASEFCCAGIPDILNPGGGLCGCGGQPPVPTNGNCCTKGSLCEGPSDSVSCCNDFSQWGAFSADGSGSWLVETMAGSFHGDVSGELDRGQLLFRWFCWIVCNDVEGWCCGWCWGCCCCCCWWGTEPKLMLMLGSMERNCSCMSFME